MNITPVTSIKPKQFTQNTSGSTTSVNIAAMQSAPDSITFNARAHKVIITAAKKVLPGHTTTYKGQVCTEEQRKEWIKRDRGISRACAAAKKTKKHKPAKGLEKNETAKKSREMAKIENERKRLAARRKHLREVRKIIREEDRTTQENIEYNRNFEQMLDSVPGYEKMRFDQETKEYNAAGWLQRVAFGKPKPMRTLRQIEADDAEEAELRPYRELRDDVLAAMVKQPFCL